MTKTDKVYFNHLIGGNIQHIMDVFKYLEAGNRRLKIIKSLTSKCGKAF